MTTPRAPRLLRLTTADNSTHGAFFVHLLADEVAALDDVVLA
jgi:hypothetical protein